jgi:hypothetical protein
MAKSSTRDVSIGKFDILATYTYAKALRDRMPEDEAKVRGMVAAIMGAQMRLDTQVGRGREDPFQAAANPGEFGCPAELAHALLTGAALDSGLTPSETRRQIDCGLAHARRQREGGNA